MTTTITQPTRVVTQVRDGAVACAETAERASEKGITPDVIYIRNDGWSLGARAEHEEACKRMWEEDWVARVEKVSGRVTPL
jgi:hypothetical protein